MKAIKLRIYPTLKQRRQLAREFAARRKVWNWALECRSLSYRLDKTSLNVVALSRLLTQAKASDTFLRSASATALNNTLWDLDAAFQNFFRKQARYPRFKKFGVVNSVCYQLDKRQFIFRDGERLSLPKLGAMRVVWSAPVPAFPNSATVSRTRDGAWFVSLQYDAPDAINPPSPVRDVIGLDFGLTTLITTSEGEKHNGRKPFKSSKRRLARYQRRLSKAAKGGINRRKLKCRVARIHRKIGDQRRDFSHQLSTRLVRENRAIGIEDLGVKGMMANGKLASAVADCGWSELRRQLTYKSAWLGRTLVVFPRFERSTGICPACGLVGEKLPLGVRTWTCGCGAHHDRDIAAAKVIAMYTARNAGINGFGLAHKPEDSGNAKVRAGVKKQTRSEQAGTDADSTAYPAVRLRA
jgi:putative transposase